MNAESIVPAERLMPEAIQRFILEATLVDALIGRPCRDSTGTVQCPTCGKPINWTTTGRRIYVTCQTLNCIAYSGRYHGKPKPRRQFHQDSLL